MSSGRSLVRGEESRRLLFLPENGPLFNRDFGAAGKKVKNYLIYKSTG
jgi:hypothetical protein